MTIGPVLIREATLDDLPFLRAMIWKALQASPTMLSRYGVEQVQQREDRYWANWQEQPDPALIAVVDGSHRVGGLTLNAKGEDMPASCWRLGIGVEESARGQGIGRALLKYAIEFTRGRGAHYLDLLVDPVNSRAIKLYRHLGFQDLGEHEGLLELRYALSEDV